MIQTGHRSERTFRLRCVLRAALRRNGNSRLSNHSCFLAPAVSERPQEGRYDVRQIERSEMRGPTGAAPLKDLVGDG